MQVLYEFDTELDTDEHGYSGLAQLIRVNPPDSPNPRSMLRRKMAAMQKGIAEMKKLLRYKV